MSDDGQTFGGCLYSEMRKLSGYNVITGIMNYKAIQQLKVSDRDDTVKLFSGTCDEVIQLLKTGEPEDVARCIVAKAAEPKQDDSLYTSTVAVMINSF